MVHIVIAPDSFKESMTALEAATAIKRGFQKTDPEATFDVIPMGDGGEGTMEALTANLGGERIELQVEGPNTKTVTAHFAISEDGTTAVMDMAAASGIHITAKADRNVYEASTYGTGEMISAALDRGVSRIIIGIGGSATNDAGAGMIEALGAKLLDENGNAINRGGGALAKLAKIDISGLDERLAKTEIIVACDVTNPLLGPEGASAVYGPQKGADERAVVELDQALDVFNQRTIEATGKDVSNIPGAGAAGGLGAGFWPFSDATLQPGIELVLAETDFHTRVQKADLVFTGEGKIDGQSVYGKTPIGVAKAAKQEGKRVIAVCGALGTGYKDVYEHGIDAVFSIVPGAVSLEDAMANGASYLEDAAENIARVWHK
ncbi:LOW QUALITY PROTEIN: glycerate kinase [Geomicrobium sp. JCM 19037]|nr:LOW QUALITY PROTEIN: glycerate kinase [Geomicrobium sp. JCM 19037]